MSYRLIFLFDEQLGDINMDFWGFRHHIAVAAF